MFETELQLVELIADVVPGVLEGYGDIHNSFSVFREVNVGYGAADIVIADIKCNCEPFDFILCEKDLAVLEMIMEKGIVGQEAVSELTRIKPAAVKKIVKKLEDSSYVIVNGEEVVLRNRYNNVVKKSFAIEAKLKNWGRALKQAYRYKCFANYSFVCLPAANALPAINNINKFKKAEVGLLTIDEERCVSTVYLPPRSCPFSQRMNMLFNELVKSSIRLNLEDLPSNVDGSHCSRLKEVPCVRL